MKIPKQQRTSKEQWLKSAMQALDNEGIAGVRIDRLARQLGVARSGFYWHFKDRRDLLDHMLEHWTRNYTEVVTSNKNLAVGPPIQRLENVMRTVRDFQLNRFEAAVFIWAQTDAAAKAAFNRAYKIRLNFIRNIYKELGFKGDEADMREQLFLGYLAWEYTNFRPQSKAKQDRLLKLRLRLLTEKNCC